MAKFKIIMEDTSKKLEEEVTRHLNSGWALHGHMIVLNDTTPKVEGVFNHVFVQSLVKPK